MKKHYVSVIKSNSTVFFWERMATAKTIHGAKRMATKRWSGAMLPEDELVVGMAHANKDDDPLKYCRIQELAYKTRNGEWRNY